MIWVAPSEKDTANDVLEKRLLSAAKQAALAFRVVTHQPARIFQIQNLRRTLDLLLPRLLSGQVNLQA